MQSRILIVSSSGLPREKIQMIQDTVSEAEIIIAEDTLSSIFAHIKNVHALIGCPRHLFSKELLIEAGPALQWIHVPGAGCEEFLIPGFIESDVILTNGRVIQGPEVADHALALVLALARNIHYILRGNLQEMPRPIELRGKVAVIVGVGGVGALIAERVAACGMRVIGVEDNYVPMMKSLDQFYLSEHLLEALPEADVVISSVPATSRTRKMFGVREFVAMKSTVYFINVSRGAVVDTEALTQALCEGRIEAAGLDVTDPEPLPHDHLLRSMPNVIITPHIAGPSDQNRQRSMELIHHNVRRFVKGLPLINVVNKKIGY